MPGKVPSLKRSEVAGHLFWWILIWEYGEMTDKQRDTLGWSIQAWKWWLDLGWPDKDAA